MFSWSFSFLDSSFSNIHKTNPVKFHRNFSFIKSTEELCFEKTLSEKYFHNLLRTIMTFVTTLANINDYYLIKNSNMFKIGALSSSAVKKMTQLLSILPGYWYDYCQACRSPSVSIDRSQILSINYIILPKRLRQELPKSFILDVAGVHDLPFNPTLFSKISKNLDYTQFYSDFAFIFFGDSNRTNAMVSWPVVTYKFLSIP